MLDPQYLAHVTDGISEIWQDWETEILADIARRIQLADYSLTTTAEWRLYTLQQMGLEQSYIYEELSKMLKKSAAYVSKIVAGSTSYALNDDIARARESNLTGIFPDFDPNDKNINRIVTAGINATNNAVKNFTGSFLGTYSNTYQTLLDRAWLNVTSGGFSASEATRMCIDALAVHGTKIIDPSGRIEQLDVVVTRAIRTGVNQTALACQLQNMKELGTNLVEVDSHAGSRPSHALWQGKVYEYVAGGKKQTEYPDFVESTGYGTGEGLGGWNCRHSFWPFFEGLSTQSNFPIAKEENERIYNLEQQQRYNERKIREYKRKVAIEPEGSDERLYAGRKLKEWKKINDDFIDSNSDVLKHDYMAEYVNRSRSSGMVNKNIGNVDLIDSYSSREYSKEVSKASYTIREMDKTVTDSLVKAFPGYKPCDLSENTTGEYRISFVKVSPNRYLVQNSLQLFAGDDPSDNVRFDTVEHASDIHERIHEVVSQIAMRRAGFFDGDIINPLNMALYVEEKNKIDKGVYLYCFTDENYNEITKKVAAEISERASDSGTELISEAFVKLAADPKNELCKKIFKYLQKEWKK